MPLFVCSYTITTLSRSATGLDCYCHAPVAIIRSFSLLLFHITVFFVIGAFAQDTLEQSIQDVLASPDWRVSELEVLAESGDSNAQAQLASLYFIGELVERNEKIGISWFRKAAENGNPVAQGVMGAAYFEGLGVEKDYNIAASWHLKAAENNYVRSQYAISIHYEKGIGVKASESESYKWLSKAAEQGKALAQHDLGVRYQTGRGVKVDSTKALRLFRLSALQDLPQAQTQLAMRYENGDGVTKNLQKAATLYEAAAVQGYPQAQSQYALMLLDGRGTEKDERAAHDLLQRAATNGYKKAQHNLGVLYTARDESFRNYREGVRWFTLAAEQGFVDSQARLAAIYGSDSPEISINCEESQKWLRMAVAQNHAGALAMMGESYFTGRCVEQSYSKSLPLLQRAVYAGEKSAAYMIALMYIDEHEFDLDYIVSYAWAKVAALEGYDEIEKMLRTKLSPLELQEAERRYGDILAKIND